MWYVYLLQSQKDKKFYIGFSENPERRLIEHQNGLVDATMHRLPVRLVYLEGYETETLAREREQKLKDFGSAYVGLLKRIRKYT